MKPKKAVIIGGGAAGFFAACRLKSIRPETDVLILEQSKLLQKVAISGGGRCNVTHACFDPGELCLNYPRGSRELLGPFHRFGPADTVSWFEERGVPIKTEADGRMFPLSNRSESIVQALMQEARNLEVRIVTGMRVSGIRKHEHSFELLHSSGSMETDCLLVATGSNQQVWAMLEALDIEIVPPVPSLFTFQLKPHVYKGLEGVSTHVHLRIPAIQREERGPLLITHWGLSGPGVLRLSAWGARELNELGYTFDVEINWLPDQEALSYLHTCRTTYSKSGIHSFSDSPLPKRLWKRLAEMAHIPEEMRWAEAGNKHLQQLAHVLSRQSVHVSGKTTFKEEFVTAGGVALRELNFKSMESKKVPGLFLAGEVVDIDAITGGFNFQNAWTCGWIAAEGMAQYLDLS